ncbi:MAG: aldo/keto reductase, partial [Gammaproteobacteria bacterium]|nr:aldo/keto reductase [Gammaproteobacteria bacterium]
ESAILPYCQKNNIAFLAHSPLDKGRLAPSLDRLEKIAKYYDKTISQIVLNWIVNHRNVIAIPKAVKREHLKQNATSTDFNLWQEHYTEIDNLFPEMRRYVGMHHISVSTTGEGNRQVYQTIEEALGNHLNLVPSPMELAEELKKGYPVKPVRLIWNVDHYDLIEGRNRYWAWYIAFDGKKAIPAYIRWGSK